MKKIKIKKPSKYKGKTICRYCPCCVKMMNCILNNKCYMFFMTMITLYALFMDDIRVLSCPVSADEILYGVTTAAFALFIIELLLSSLAIDGYLLGFYFWLDLIATVSLISDIGWIWNRIFPQQSIQDFENNSGTTTKISSNNVKGAKTGTRIG